MVSKGKSFREPKGFEVESNIILFPHPVEIGNKRNRLGVWHLIYKAHDKNTLIIRQLLQGYAGFFIFLVFFLIKVKRTHILLIRLKENNYSTNIQKLRDSSGLSDFCSKKYPSQNFLAEKSPRFRILGFEPTSACKDLLLIKHKLKSDGEIKLQLEQMEYIFIHLRFL